MSLQTNRSLGQLVQDIVSDVQEIIRSEFLLAKVETRQELSKATKSSAILVAGAVFSVYALGFLFLTIVYVLEMTAAARLAALIVAVGVAIVAMLLIFRGKKTDEGGSHP
jgi:uncharacterized membrane protein YqjE